MVGCAVGLGEVSIRLLRAVFRGRNQQKKREEQYREEVGARMEGIKIDHVNIPGWQCR
jgi:hypothetical protein